MVGTTVALHEVLAHHCDNMPSNNMEPSDKNAFVRTLRYHYLFKVYMPFYRLLHSQSTDSDSGQHVSQPARLLSSQDYMRRKFGCRKSYSVAGLPSAENQSSESQQETAPQYAQSSLNISVCHQSPGKANTHKLSTSYHRRSREKLRNSKTLSIPEESELDFSSVNIPQQKVVSQDSGYNGSCMGLAGPCGHCEHCNVYSNKVSVVEHSKSHQHSVVRRHRSCPEKRTVFSKLSTSRKDKQVIMCRGETINSTCTKEISQENSDKKEKEEKFAEGIVSHRQNTHNRSQLNKGKIKKVQNSDSTCSLATETSDVTVIESKECCDNKIWPSLSKTDPAVLDLALRKTTVNNCDAPSDLEASSKHTQETVKDTNSSENCVNSLKSAVTLCCESCSGPVQGNFIKSSDSAILDGDLNANVVVSSGHCSKCKNVKHSNDTSKQDIVCKPKVPGYKLADRRGYSADHSVKSKKKVAGRPTEFFRGKTQVHLSEKIKYTKLQTCLNYDCEGQRTETRLSRNRESCTNRYNSAKLIYMQNLQKAYNIGLSKSEHNQPNPLCLEQFNSKKATYKRGIQKLNGVSVAKVGAYGNRKNRCRLERSQSFTASQLTYRDQNNPHKDTLSCESNRTIHACRSFSNILPCYNLQTRKNDRQEILRKLAMGGEEEGMFGGPERALKKTNMQVGEFYKYIIYIN